MSKKQRETFRPGIANRLDRNTSGLILFGKNLASLQSLGRMMQEHRIEKHYYALVTGDFQKEGLQESFSVLHKYRDGNQIFTLLSVKLLTGKTHQIRSQLSFLQHPILGDDKYGNREMNKLYKNKGIKRQLLHAYSLSFPAIEKEDILSPLSEKNFTIPMPADFQDLVESCEEIS